MKLDKDNSRMIARLDDGEIPQEHLLRATIQKADESQCWSLDVVIDPNLANEYRDMLYTLGFTIAGSESKDARTFLKLRHGIRTSGETGSETFGELAIPAPCLASSDAEQAALDLTRQRITAKLASL